jgi:hypothetical protein
MNTKLLSWFPKALFIPVMVLLITLLNSQTARAAGVCYVKASASGANNGTSWANAYTNLQSALGASTCTEVWVAAGTYKPTGGTDRTLSFTLKNGVALYGGFAGTETQRSQRNPAANVTTLSGDIGTPSDPADNSYHVVSGGGTDGTAVLDGFTITGGNANDSYDTQTIFGGGMYNDASSPTLTNVIFSGSTAIYGGGMYNTNSSNPTLTNVTFNNNPGGGMRNDINSSPTLTNVTFNNNPGGGMRNDNNSNPTLTNVAFKGNTSVGDEGGGMRNDNNSSPTLTNVTFSGNSSSAVFTLQGSLGGEGGGMYNRNNSNPTLTNVTFSGNSAYLIGGGMRNWGSNPTLTNVTFSGNSANYGGGMYNQNSSPQIKDNIFWGNSASVAGAEIYNSTSSPSLADSVVAGGCPSGTICTNIITANPLLGPLANNGGFTQTMALNVGSSAIDTGNDATCASTDQRGVTRPQGAHCDMGAYEWVDYAYQIYLPLVIR